jgi:hypothetical protein
MLWIIGGWNWMGITEVKAFGTDDLESTAVGFEFKAKLPHVYSGIK